MPEKNKEGVKKEKNDSDNNKKKKSKKIKKSTLKKISTIIVLITILAVVLYFASKTLRPEETLAEVNGEIITKQELDQKYTQLPDQYKLFITEEAFLEQIINVKLLLQEAQEQEMVVTEEEIEEELETLRMQTPTDEAFEDLLKQRNIDLPELKKQISEQLTINKLLDETVLSKIEISDSKIKQYYNENIETFKAKEGEIRARHILVSEEEQAKQLLKDLQAGKDFSELAKLNSLDTSSGERGGDLGFFGKGQMVKEFEDAAFSLRVGQLSPIVETQFGYHIIKREGNSIPYRDAKEQIRQILLNEISNNAIEIYIDQLRLDATIIIEGEETTETEEEAEISEEEELSEEEEPLEETEQLGEIETFKETKDPICKEDNKVIIRLFSGAKNSASKWISQTFDDVTKEHQDDIIAYNWQLDTGDNTLTAVEETGIPKSEVEIYKKYNSKNTVPTYVFGCKYTRIGNAYESLEEEEAEFKRVIEKLIS